MEWMITLTFNKHIKSIVVHNGKDEKCISNTCTFKNSAWNGVNQKDGKISLTYEIAFETSSTSNLIGISFNGQSVCSASAKSGNTKTKPLIKGKYINDHR